MQRSWLSVWLIACLSTPRLAWAEPQSEILSLYRQGKYADCLAAIEPLRSSGPLSTLLLSTSANCKLQSGSSQGARAEYTQVLARSPLIADQWVGRAECELAMGSIRDGEADFAIANRIDARVVEPFKPGYEKLLALAKQVVVKESVDALWPKFLAAARTETDQKLVDLAVLLMRARNAERHNGDEDFNRADADYALAVRDKPNDVEALLAEATFLLNPLIDRQTMLNGTVYAAKVPVHDAEPARAESLLAIVLKLEPGNARAMAQMAQVCIDNGRHSDAFNWADRAIAAGVSSLDVCRMHLIGGTNVAQGLDARAAQLRQPTTRMGERIVDGRRIPTTISIPPTSEALAEADRLTGQSNELRRRAVAPLLQFIEKVKAGNTTGDQVNAALGNAYLCEWRARYNEAIGWANKAVEIDPFQSEALLLLVQLCTSMHEDNLAHQAQARLNNAQNRAAGITLDGVWPLMRQRQFAQARQLLAQADQQDPGSIGLACARFAMAQEEGKLDDAIYAVRLISAMNLARVLLDGRAILAKPPATVAGIDVVLPVYTFTILGGLLNDAKRSDEALRYFNRAIAFTQAVPRKELSVPVPDTAVPNDPKNGSASTYLEAVLGSAHRQAGELLLAKNKLPEAAPHLLAAALTGDRTPQLPFMAYRCYKTVGLEGFQGKIPEAWRGQFVIWDQQHININTPDNSAEILDLQINQITRQINQGVGPDDLRELTAKRDALIAKREKLQQAR